MSTLLANLLLQSGHPTGLYTSPHVLTYNERIRINDKYATDKEICEVFAQVDFARGGTSLTYFEFGTLAATELFRRHAVRFAVLEVGLGGRLDAVNVFEPTVSVITSIDIDHQEWLGSDRESIALEKAGIMRPGVPCLLGESDPPRSIADKAAKLEVPLLQLGREIQYSWNSFTESWSLYSPTSEYRDLPMPSIQGRAQLDNAALSIVAAETVLGDAVPRSVITSALQETRLLGRQQVVCDEIETVFDVAHNPSAARELVSSLCKSPKRTKLVVLIGMYADKDIGGFASELARFVESWHVMPISGNRAASPHEIGDILCAVVPVSRITVHTDPDNAIESARKDAAKRACTLLVTGSFETVGAVLASKIYLSTSSRSD